MDKRMIGWAIALGLCAGSAIAAEWNTTTDLTRDGLSFDHPTGEIGATTEALWLGDAAPIDPYSGAALSPHLLPERVTIGSHARYMRAVSSRRGLLWSLDDEHAEDAITDRAGSLWLLKDAGILTRIAADGAQVKQWTGVDLGAATSQLSSLRAQKNGEGVLLVIRTSESGGVFAESVWLSSEGRVNRRRAAPACTTDAFDDGVSGFYALCRSGAELASIQRIGANPTMTWNEPRSVPGLQEVRVTLSGGLLIRTAEGAVQTWRHLDDQGNERFAVAGTLAAESGSGFWIADERASPSVLVHVDAAGVELGRATSTDTDLIDLAAHANGNVLLDSFDPYANLFGVGHKTLFGASGNLIRSVVSTGAVPGLESRLRFDRGLPLAMSEGTPGHAALIDAAGQPTSAPFPLNDNDIHRVLADAHTLCTEETPRSSGNGSGARIRCYARNSGMFIGEIFGTDANVSRSLLGVNGVVSVLEHSRIGVYSPNGSRLREIPLGTSASVNEFDFDPEVGTAVWDANSLPSVQLRRYAANGELLFNKTLDAAQSTYAWELFLNTDGTTFVAKRREDPKLERYDALGNLIGTHPMSRVGLGDEVIDVRSTANGVQALLQPFGLSASRPATLLILSPDLATVRASHALGNVPVTVSGVGIWPRTDGEPVIAVSGQRTLALLRYDSLSGRLISRAVLPTASPAKVDRKDASAFAIDTDGEVRLLEFDPARDRNVLRRYTPAASAFNGPIRQTALSGSWYAPSSTGQGLIVDLLNGGAQLFAAWHTYAPEGGNSLAKQQWLSVQGQVGAARGAISLPIYRNSGGRFDDVGMTDAVAVGTADLVFTSCDRMEFWYRIGDEMGALPLQRLTPRTLPCDNGASVEAAVDAAPPIDLTGPWYDPSRSGQGLAVSASGTQFNQFFAGWFTYDADNADDPDAQHWFSVQGANPARYGDPVTARIYRTIGGSRSGEPTRNTHVVGSAQLTVHDCGNATLEYVFDDSVVAGAFANQSRSVPLVRLGSCND